MVRGRKIWEETSELNSHYTAFFITSFKICGCVLSFRCSAFGGNLVHSSFSGTLHYGNNQLISVDNHIVGISRTPSHCRCLGAPAFKIFLSPHW